MKIWQSTVEYYSYGNKNEIFHLQLMDLQDYIKWGNLDSETQMPHVLSEASNSNCLDLSKQNRVTTETRKA